MILELCRHLTDLMTTRVSGRKEGGRGGKSGVNIVKLQIVMINQPFDPKWEGEDIQAGDQNNNIYYLVLMTV